MARRFASTIVRARYVVVVVWIAAAAAATLLLPSIEEVQTGSLGDLVANDGDAVSAEQRSADLFGFPLLSRTVVVQRDPGGLSAEEQARVARRAVALNRGEYPGLTGIAGALAVTNALGRPPFSRESSTTALTYLFFPTDIGQVGRTGLAQRFVERHVRPAHGGYVGVTGAVSARAEQVETINDALPLVEAATVAVVALAIGLHFRAAGAPLLNLVAVGIAYLVAVRAMVVVGEFAGINVPSEVEPIVVVLLFGVVTDYSIFFLSRFRRAVAEGRDARAAAVATTADLLPTILTAGLTVVFASASLVVARLGFFEAFGPGMALAVLVGLVVSLTFTPAAVAICGERVFWPRTPRDSATEAAAPRRRYRVRALSVASRRPLATIALTGALLLALASGTTRIELGNTLIRGLPESSEPRVALRQAAQGFAPGILSPTVVLVEGEGVARSRGELSRLQRLLERQPGVAEVVGPRDQPTDQNLGVVYSPTGDAVRYLVVLNADPLSSQGIAHVERLQRRLDALLARSGFGDRIHAAVAGDTALSAESVTKTAGDLKRVAPAAILVVLLVLAIFLRALVAPLYLVASSVLALTASLGLTAYLFQDVLGYGQLTYYVPFAAAVLLVALGSDYNVFLAGRVWAEARVRPLREAVEVGGARAAGAITAAGLVLAASFALLALVPLRPFRELAFAMSAGLLIDAFVVRTLLVPALIVLVGSPSGWPGALLRRHVRPGTGAAEAG